MTLEEENKQLKTENALLQAQVLELTQRLLTLENRLAQNSHNSSKPPSTDGFVRSPKKRSLRRVSGKKSGGQTAHPGHSLELSTQPDQVLTYAPTKCQKCQAALSPSNSNLYLKERRQVWEVPPVCVQVVEHQSLACQCPNCGSPNAGAFPAAVNNRVQYGPGVAAIAIYLCCQQLLPFARTCEVLHEVWGLSLSQGTLAQMLQTAYTRLEPAEQVIKTGLIQTAVLNNDETGFYVRGQRCWLHVACSDSLTHYGWQSGRGKAATDALGILPHYQGISVHDGYQSYPKYACQHALCNAHHLRELTFVAEQLKQSWASALITLLCDLKDEVAQARQASQTKLADQRLEYYQTRYSSLLAIGLEANAPPAGGWPVGKRGRPKQTKAKNLLDRLQTHQVEVLRFATDFRVPFDNNQAARDLRMMKVQQKISGCFRSEAGASYFCRIRSYLSTMRKQGHQIFKVLQQVFGGQLPLPVLGV